MGNEFLSLNQGAHSVLEQAVEAIGAIRAGRPRQMSPDVLTVQNCVPRPLPHQGHPIRGQQTVSSCGIIKVLAHWGKKCYHHPLTLNYHFHIITLHIDFNTVILPCVAFTFKKKIYF